MTKVRLPDVALTNVAAQMRLRELGLRHDPQTGEIDPSSMNNVAGGAAAVAQAAGKDGVLDLFEMSTLRPSTSDWRADHALDKRALAINARVAALGMEADHLTGLTGAMVDHMYALGRVDAGAVRTIEGGFARFQQRLGDYQRESGNLGLVDPHAATSLAASLGKLQAACAGAVHVLSHARTQLLQDRSSLRGERYQLFASCDAALKLIDAARSFATAQSAPV